MWPLSAATMPRGVDRKSPRVDLPIRFISLWYSPSTPLPPFQVSSAAYNIVPWTMAVWRVRAAAGGTPCVLRSLASTCLALPSLLRRFSTRVSDESSQMPSHRVASLAKQTCWSPTFTAWPPCRCFLFLDKRMASVFVVSKRAALPPAHWRLASAHLSSFRTTSSRSTPSATQVTSSAKRCPGSPQPGPRRPGGYPRYRWRRVLGRSGSLGGVPW